MNWNFRTEAGEGNIIFFKYIIVGGSTALLELLLFLGLRRGVGFDLASANILAMGIATGVNFLMNRNWSFRSSTRVSRSFVLYISLILFNMVFTTWLIALLVSWGVSDFWAKFMMMAAATLWNFALYRKVIFT
ncbi:putative flippase GtrA [Desulfitobacterium sp. LBE]|uniref:GtrA family protein n=1 Tax=Desulfitobacterium TaxID=36853 RepID=UPI00035F22D0|nr:MULTISPECIES: GtrA family protein [Desulfitobacterium]TWH56610.1 putative flippase GtrA [Desulfitobacterium sp. LBE]